MPPFNMLPSKYIKRISRGQGFREKLRHRKRKFEDRFSIIPSWLVATTAVVVLAIITVVFDNVKPENSHGIKGQIIMALKTIFQNAESIAITTAVIIYIKEGIDRKKQKHYEAWQVIDQAAAGGKSTSPARFRALQDLSDDHVSLRGLDLNNIDLRGIKLAESDLCFTDFTKSNLNSADLSKSNLVRANLSEVDAGFINLSHSHPTAATFNNAKLRAGNLAWSVLEQAQFIEADLTNTNFTDAYLFGADFTNADLSSADFSGADLTNANLSNAILFEADLEKAINLSPTQISGRNSPFLCCTKLPSNIKGISPDRDCDKVALFLDERYSIGVERAHHLIKSAKEKSLSTA